MCTPLPTRKEEHGVHSLTGVLDGASDCTFLFGVCVCSLPPEGVGDDDGDNVGGTVGDFVGALVGEYVGDELGLGVLTDWKILC